MGTTDPHTHTHTSNQSIIHGAQPFPLVRLMQYPTQYTPLIAVTCTPATTLPDCQLCGSAARAPPLPMAHIINCGIVGGVASSQSGARREIAHVPARTTRTQSPGSDLDRMTARSPPQSTFDLLCCVSLSFGVCVYDWSPPISFAPLRGTLSYCSNSQAAFLLPIFPDGSHDRRVQSAPYERTQTHKSVSLMEPNKSNLIEPTHTQTHQL